MPTDVPSEVRPEIGLATLDFQPEPRRAGREVYLHIPAADEGLVCLALVAADPDTAVERYGRALAAGALAPGRLAVYDLATWKRRQRAEAPHIRHLAGDAEALLASRSVAERLTAEIEADLDAFVWRRLLGERAAVYAATCLADEVSARRGLEQYRRLKRADREASGLERYDVERLAAEEARRYPYRSPKGVAERVEALLQRNAPRLLPGDVLRCSQPSRGGILAIRYLSAAGWNVCALGGLWTYAGDGLVVDMWSGEILDESNPPIPERRSA